MKKRLGLRVSTSSFVALLLTAFIIPFSSAQSTETTIVLTTIKDTYVDDSTPDLNFGASPDLTVSHGASNVTSFVVFDLSKLPGGIGSFKASLLAFLRAKGSDATSRISVHKLLDLDWDELRVNGLTRPDYSPVPTFLNDIVAFSGKWQAWDVSKDVEAAVRDGRLLVGWALVSQTTSGVNVFSSSQSSEKPKLELRVPGLDVTPPEIIGVGLGSVASGLGVAEVRVVAVDDLSGVAGAVLSYSLDNSSWTDVVMHARSDFYVAVLPESPLNSTLWYVVEVVDAAGNVARSPVFTFVVGRPLNFQDLLSSYELLLANYNRLLQRFRELSGNFTFASSRLKEVETGFNSLSELYSTLQSQLGSADVNYSTLERQYKELQQAYDALNSAYQELRANYAWTAENYSRIRGFGWLLVIVGLTAGGATAAFWLSLWILSRKKSSRLS